MNTNVKKSILLTVIFFAIISLIQYSMDLLYNKKSNQKFNLLLQHKIDSSIMVFGSSVAFVHVDPKVITQQTGLSCYNMGYHGVFLPQSMPLINEYLSYQKNSKCIVITCDYESMKRNTLITRPDMFLSHLSNPYIFNSFVKYEPSKIYKARYVPGYKLTLMNKAFFRSIFLGEKKDKNYAGFEPFQSGWIGSSLDSLNLTVRYEEDIYKDLQQLVAKIKSKKIPLILVLPPIYHEGLDLLKKREVVDGKYMQLADNESVFFINYTTDSICYNKSYFYNFSHMNARGAQVFSTKLGSQIDSILHSHKL